MAPEICLSAFFEIFRKILLLCTRSNKFYFKKKSENHISKRRKVLIKNKTRLKSFHFRNRNGGQSMEGGRLLFSFFNSFSGLLFDQHVLMSSICNNTLF